jgi:DNA-binding transcriptional MerR regulator
MSGDMLTIGAFAKACRLSPKALRLYDELELLRPARADPDTGYRYYAVAQLERARPVAWLRRLGMPLPEIRTVCALVPPRTGAAVRAYWARVAAETAVRRDLVPRQAMSARQGAASGACSGGTPCSKSLGECRPEALVLDVPGLSAGAARVRAGRRDGAHVACCGTSPWPWPR